ncbi:unnamed protein product [Musa acuminata var. zebrina]
MPTRDYLFASSLGDICQAVDFIHYLHAIVMNTFLQLSFEFVKWLTKVLAVAVQNKNMTPITVVYQNVKLTRPRVVLASSQWKAVQDFYHLRVQKKGRSIYSENLVVKAQMLLFSRNLGAFDLDGYDGSIEAGRVGNAVWAELRLMYRLQIARQAAALARLSHFWIKCHAHRSSSEMNIAIKVRKKDMGKNHGAKVFLGLSCSFLILLLLYAWHHCFRRRFLSRRAKERSLEDGGAVRYAVEEELVTEELIKFAGWENLTSHDILDAPGEVVAKSSYGTLYRACIRRSKSVALLRFVRPDCIGRIEEVLPAVRMLGSVRHPNLVPTGAMYVGPRGEKLFVHPFYASGTLAQFLRAGVAEAHRWDIIYKLACGVARGLDHLHNGYEKAIIHGNLNSNNILLDADFQPRLSDFGLHIILNPAAALEMLEAPASQGYRAPELIKMKDASRETDIYGLGVVFLEMLTQKDPLTNNFLQSKDLHLPTSLRILVLEHKVSDVFSSNLLEDSINQNSTNEEGLLMLFQLAMTCCSPSPALRPDIRAVIRRLEDIGR